MCYNGVTVKINLTKYKQIQRWEVYVQTYWVEPPWFFFLSNSSLDFNNDKEESANQSNFGAYKNTSLIIKTAE